MPIAVTNTAHFNTGAITHGQQVNASNTGIAGAGLEVGDLTSQAGQTYSVADAVIEDIRFTSPVTIRASGITMSRCLFDFAGGASTSALIVDDDDFVGEDLTIAPGSGSYFNGVLVAGGAFAADDMTLRRCDISACENLIGPYGERGIIETSYLHGPSNASNPGGHIDGLEYYAGGGQILRLCRIEAGTPTDITAAVNIAPWFGAASCDGLQILDNFIDGGNAHILVDIQSTGTINDLQVLRNKFGGHTNTGVFGRYAAIQNEDSRTIDNTYQGPATTSIHWPWTGDDVNTWDECDDLTPDNTGDTVDVRGV